jgi:hypothetical protein
MGKEMLLSTLLLSIPILLNIRDVDGHELKPLEPAGPANILFFITNDCPIANSYAPEIQRICGDYAAKGVGCTLAYSDLTLDAAAIRFPQSGTPPTNSPTPRAQPSRPKPWSSAKAAKCSIADASTIFMRRWGNRAAWPPSMTSGKRSTRCSPVNQ